MRDAPGRVPSTIGEILKRHDLIKPRRRRRPRMTWSRARTLIDAPNQVWTADFKGQFRLRNGLLCYPLTILDGHTRFLLTCKRPEDDGNRARSQRL